MSPLKLAAALSVAVIAVTVISTRLATQTPVAPPQAATMAVQTQAILLPAFETPSWVPDETTKKKALMKAYHMTGTMNLWGGIDVSDLLDDPPPMPASNLPTAEELAQRPPSTYFRPPDICQRHGMHKVITDGGKSWRCQRSEAPDLDMNDLRKFSQRFWEKKAAYDAER